MAAADTCLSSSFQAGGTTLLYFLWDVVFVWVVWAVWSLQEGKSLAVLPLTEEGVYTRLSVHSQAVWMLCLQRAGWAQAV